jgi:hypothetical protein
VVSASIQSHTFASARRLVRVARPAAAIVAVLAMTFVVTNRAGAATTRSVAIDLANPAGSGTGDAAADHVIVNGTNGDDNVHVRGKDGAAKVSGLVPTVTIAGAEFANDRLDINTLPGVDTVHSHLALNDIALFVNGNLA